MDITEYAAGHYWNGSIQRLNVIFLFDACHMRRTGRGKIIILDEIPGVETLTAEAGIEKANSKHKPVILDARINRDRTSGYTEESSSLSDINNNCDTLNRLVANTLTPIVFDCYGSNCGRSVVAIKIAKSCAYKSLSRTRGGFEEWRKKRISNCDAGPGTQVIYYP